jgi:hypothetical protein
MQSNLRHALAFFSFVALLGNGAVLEAQYSLTDETVFSYQLDSFEVSAPFLPGGHVIDEFDDGVLEPWVTNGFGTAVEADGVVTFSNPAVADSWAPFRLVTLHRSDIFAPPTFAVQAGQGSFEATSIWLTPPEPPSGFYGLALTYIVPGTWNNETMSGTLRTYSVFTSNLSEGLATAFADGIPTPGGLAIGQVTGLVDGVGPGNLDTEEQLEFFPQSSLIDPFSVTGPIVLKLIYDDNVQEISTAFSVDGGTTYVSPFPPLSVALPTGTGAANFDLIADPPTLVGDCPEAPASCLTAQKHSLKIKDGKLKWKWNKGTSTFLPEDFGIPVDGGGNSYSLCIYDDVAGTPVLRMGAKVGADDTCGPLGDATCWKSTVKGGGYKKKNGNVDGVTKVKLKGGEAGKPSVQVMVTEGSVRQLKSGFQQDPLVTIQLHASDPSNCWESTFSASDTKENALGVFKAKAP